MKNKLLILCILFVAAVGMHAQTITRGSDDFVHGFSTAQGTTGNMSYAIGIPFHRQPQNDAYSMSQGPMQAQLIRLDMVLQGAQNDSLAVSPSHVHDTAGFFLGYDGEEMVFDGKLIHVFPVGHYDSTAYDAVHYNWDAEFGYDSLTSLLLDVLGGYEFFDTLYLDSTEIVTDYASNELHIPAYAWHQLHGGPNLYKLKTVHGTDSLRHYFVNLCGGVVKDADGNEYLSVYLGEAPERYCWTKRNMETTSYTSGGEASSMVYNGAFHSDEAENLATYGRLYDWNSAVNVPAGSEADPPTTQSGNFVRGICPAGWHVPDSANMASLNNIDPLDIKADILWLSPGNDHGDGFYALPAGYYNPTKNRYEKMTCDTYYWSTVRKSRSECWVCSFEHGCNLVVTENMSIESGLSVRCVKDQIFDEDGNEVYN